MNPKVEPKEAFPYKPPTKEIKEKYQHIFALKEPLEDRFPKLIFDKVVAALLLLIASPILLLLRIAYFVEGLLIPEMISEMKSGILRRHQELFTWEKVLAEYETVLLQWLPE